MTSAGPALVSLYEVLGSIGQWRNFPERIARGAGGPVELLKLEDCGHSPHKDQAEKVTRAVVDFLRRCSGFASG